MPEIRQDNRANKRIALIVQAVKLTDAEPGLDRAAYVAKLLASAGYQVDLITSVFQHWQKSRRSGEYQDYGDNSYNVVFLEEPGYKKNIDLRRVGSHSVLRSSLGSHFQQNHEKYDAVWCQIPPNNIAAEAAVFAHDEHIPFIVDVNDLWPEAMKMAVNIPILSDIMFAPFSRDAKKVFNLVSAIVGTSQEYADHPDSYRSSPVSEDKKLVVYVGNDIAAFDAGAVANPVRKPEDEIWVTYAGTLGKSYDIEHLIQAADAAYAALEGPQEGARKIRLKILGDGPDREHLEEKARNCNLGVVEFLGYMPYEKMAGYLVASDIVVNSLVKEAPQSIVSKIGDYLASATPMINTGRSPEMCDIVEREQIGVNVEPENSTELANAIVKLAGDAELRSVMGARARRLAEEKFDRKSAYAPIVDLIDALVL